MTDGLALAGMTDLWDQPNSLDTPHFTGGEGASGFTSPFG